MDYRVEVKPTMYVIGIQIKTSNATCMQDMPLLWQKFMQEGLVHHIPTPTNQSLLAVYSGYDGDHTKPYNYLIGMQVDSVDEVPVGMVAKIIPSQKYAIFTGRGTFPENLQQVWRKIWEPDFDALRAYTVDFEVYDERCQNPQASEIDVYIALK